MMSMYSRPVVACDASVNLICGDLLTFGDLSLAFFGIVLYFTEKLHCLIAKG